MSDYQYPTGTGLTGAAGTNGANGSAWYEGSGVPSALHNVGDFYLNVTNGDVYEETSASPLVWTLVGNIKGPVGATGPQGPQGPSGSLENVAIYVVTPDSVSHAMSDDYWIAVDLADPIWSLNWSVA